MVSNNHQIQQPSQSKSEPSMNSALREFLQETVDTLSQYVESARAVRDGEGEGLPVSMSEGLSEVDARKLDSGLRELDGLVDHLCRVLTLHRDVGVLSGVPVAVRSAVPVAPSGAVGGPLVPSGVPCEEKELELPSSSKKRKHSAVVESFLSVEHSSDVISAWTKKKKKVSMPTKDVPKEALRFESDDDECAEECAAASVPVEGAKYGYPSFVLSEVSLLECAPQRNMHPLFLQGSVIREFSERDLRDLYSRLPHRRSTFTRTRTFLRNLCKLNKSWGMKSNLSLEKNRVHFDRALDKLLEIISWYNSEFPSVRRYISGLQRTLDTWVCQLASFGKKDTPSKDTHREHPEFGGKKPRLNLSLACPPPPSGTWIHRGDGGKMLLPSKLNVLPAPVARVSVLPDVLPASAASAASAAPAAPAAPASAPVPIVARVLPEDDDDANGPPTEVEDNNDDEVLMTPGRCLNFDAVGGTQDAVSGDERDDRDDQDYGGRGFSPLLDEFPGTPVNFD